MNFDENALICDLAETYHILDYRSHSVQLIATLSAGLRENSRIKLRISEMPVSQETLLLATIADRVEMFRYGFADQKKNDAPVSIVETLYGNTKKNTKGVKGFDTADEFESALAKLKGE